MRVRVLDLDDGISAKREVVARCKAQLISLQDWGPRIRIACSWGTYRRFEWACHKGLGTNLDAPALTLYGSGDFHHVTLALLRRLRGPFNLLVLDKHPDWMRGVPVLHCGTWLYHALKLPNLQRVLHLGGELDFDNLFRWLAPWQSLRSGRIMTFPAVRRFKRGKWRQVSNEPLREHPQQRLGVERLEAILADARGDLARYPLYISLDKDVMNQCDAVVNWDSGYLELSEVQLILNWLIAACGGNLAGMDILGDWSPVRVQGLLRCVLHATEHPSLAVDARAAAQRNAVVNLALVESVRSALSKSRDCRTASLAG